MKKIIARGVVFLLVAALGVFAGNSLHKATDSKNKEEAEIKQDKIALVNLDRGYENSDGGAVNYANELVEPKENYETVSFQKAEEGIGAGRYAAYVVIPEDFSESVESINTKPKTAQLQYQISKRLDKDSTAKAMNSVTDFANDVGYKVSYLYLTTVVSEFQEGQKSAKKILENDKKDLAAIKSVNPIDLVANTKIPEIPQNTETVEDLDVSQETKQTDSDLKDIEKTYQTVSENTEKTMESMSKRVKQFDAGKPVQPGFDQLLTVSKKEDGSPANAYTDLTNEIVKSVLLQGAQSFEAYKDKAYILDTKDTIEKDGKTYVNFDSAEKLSWQKQGDESGSSIFEQPPEQVMSGLVQSETVEAKKKQLLEELNAEYEKAADETNKNVQKETENIQTEFKEMQKKLKESYLVPGAQLLSGFTANVAANTGSITNKSVDKSQEYKSNSEAINNSTMDYAGQLYSYVQKTKEESDQVVTKGLQQAQSLKTTSSKENTQLVRQFVAKLPNSQLNNGQNQDFKEQIASPVTINGDGDVKQATTKSLDKMLILNGILILVLGLSLIMYYLFTLIKKRKKAENAENGRKQWHSYEDA